MVDFSVSSLDGILLLLFFALLLPLAVLPNFKQLFYRHHAKKHRVAGFIHLLLLLIGSFINSKNTYYYHLLLAVSGIITAYTAVNDFQHHKRVNNAIDGENRSGTLEKDATVSHAEMVEHTFYQGINLLQIVYLYNLPSDPLLQYIATCAMVLPWWYRNRFPINSFSSNWKMSFNANKQKKQPLLTNAMYLFKKTQYLFYKHVLLHGLNICVAFLEKDHINGESLALVETPTFQTYWLLLNVSYVMEFFLQTLVKKKMMSQCFMLLLQNVLMIASAWAVGKMIWETSNGRKGRQLVLPFVASMSVTLNFLRRGHEVSNVIAVATIANLLFRK